MAASNIADEVVMGRSTMFIHFAVVAAAASSNMISNRTPKKAVASSIFALLVLWALPQTASAARITTSSPVVITQHSLTDFSFFQDGFTGGGFVSGTFSGVDLNGDGRLIQQPGLFSEFEITAFSMSFSGNTLLLPFSLGFADLFQVAYDLDGGPLGESLADKESLMAFGWFPKPYDHFGLYQGASPSCGPQFVCGVVAVPEPGIFLLWTIGIAGILRRTYANR